MLFASVSVVLIWSSLVFTAGARSPLIAARKRFDLTPPVPARFSNLTASFQPFAQKDLFVRQEECVDPGYEPCPNNDGCCPAGETCLSDGCCPAGQTQCASTGCYDPSEESCCSDGSACPSGSSCVGNEHCCPTGQQQCGNSEYCYDPETEQCCQDGGGACPKTDSCCEYECCRSVATCADDGFCSASTCIETSTYSSTTYYAVHTTSVTEVAPPEGEEEAPEFSCPEMTATNSAGDELELGDNCLLTLSLASGNASSTSPSSPPGPTARAVPAKAIPAVQPRITAAADAECLYTSTTTSTYIVRAISTVTVTITTEAEEEKFSCLPMTVTNSNGDELSLDDECSLEFSPNTAAPTSTGGSGGSGGGKHSSASSSGVPLTLLAVALMTLILAVAL